MRLRTAVIVECAPRLKNNSGRERIAVLKYPLLLQRHPEPDEQQVRGEGIDALNEPFAVRFISVVQADGEFWPGFFQPVARPLYHLLATHPGKKRAERRVPPG